MLSVFVERLERPIMSEDNPSEDNNFVHKGWIGAFQVLTLLEARSRGAQPTTTS